MPIANSNRKQQAQMLLEDREVAQIYVQGILEDEEREKESRE